MEQLPETTKMPDSLKFLLMTLVLFLIWSIHSTYSTLLDSDNLILLASKQNNFVKIPSNIDKAKLKEAYKNDPVKLIYDPNFSYLSKVNGTINQITIFIEFNPFSQKCEMSSRVSGIWKFLDTFSEAGPFYMNIKSFEIDNSYCSMIYGYGKINPRHN